MEIFKAASKSLDTTINTQTNNIQTREVEHTKIQENVVNKNSDINELDNLSNEDIAKQMKDTTSKLNYQMEQLGTNIRFSYNQEENIMVVQVREANSGELIRELPSKEAIRIAKYFKESIGLLFDRES